MVKLYHVFSIIFVIIIVDNDRKHIGSSSNERIGIYFLRIVLFILLKGISIDCTISDKKGNTHAWMWNSIVQHTLECAFCNVLSWHHKKFSHSVTQYCYTPEF